MASAIKPFSATYYNPSFIKNYSQVVCPPYDVITKEQLISLRKNSKYNFSRILIADNNNYQKSADTLKRWLNKKILIDDDKENLYLYEQKFGIEKKSLRRFGILSLLRMDKKGIFPHEYTLGVPKQDRKRIIEKTKANLSPIFVIATQNLPVLESIYKHYCKKQPLFQCEDNDGTINRVWRVSDRQHITEICGEISLTKVVIADGHHRFETSFSYFKKNKNKFKDLNYILAYITGRQKGLTILPTHRVIDINEAEQVLLQRLRDYFNIEEVSERELEKRLESRGQFCFGIYQREKFLFLMLKDKTILDKITNNLYSQLDTYIFHQVVLPLFTFVGNIQYTHSIAEAKKIAGFRKVAFLLRAVPLETVLEISQKGFRLPQKSTYFYPKLLSGLVIRRFQR